MNFSCLRFPIVVLLLSLATTSLKAQDILIEDVIFSVNLSEGVNTLSATSNGGLDFQVFPNPTSDLLTLQTLDGAMISQVQITSLANLSTTVLTPQTDANSLTLSLDNLPVGHYTILIVTASGSLSQTIEISN